MTGLLGWVDGAAECEAAATLAAMAGAARAGAALKVGMSGAAAALAAWPTHATASMHDAGGISAVVVGDAYWGSADLQQQAGKTSLAASAIDAYRMHGPSFLERLQGTFALALVDTLDQVAVLAIDRLGIQALAFAHSSDWIAFATDARAVAAYPRLDGALDAQAIFNYLFFHMVPSPGSIFSGVEKLLPGECAIWRQGRLERHFYWRLVYREEGGGEFEEKAGRFKSLLRDAVQSAAGSSQQVGAFLSGGTDSSTVTGMLTQILGRPVDTFSIGFDADGYDEMEYARIATRHFRSRSHEYYLTPADVAAAIPRIAAAYDEPFGNASAVPAYYCARLARDAGIDLMLAGDGGDEIFGGNARYAKQKIFEFYWKLPAWARKGVIEPLSGGLPSAGLLRKAKSYVSQARIPLPDRLEAYNFLHREPLHQILMPDFLAQIQAGQPVELLREVYDRTEARSFINRMLHLDLKFTLADNDLRKVNRACELAGVSVRYPLLDDKLVAFSAGLAPDDKVRGQCLRYFFKQALNDFLPREIIGKSKHGFGLPFGLWMQKHAELHALAGDSLACLRTRDIVHPEYIDRLLDQHQRGHAAYYGVMIWVLVMLEQWLQQRQRVSF